MAIYENSIRLKGFIGKDAEIKSTSNGTAFAIFSLATKSGYRDRETGNWVERTEWHRISSFGKVAAFAKELKKGDYAEIEGELRSSEYEPEARDGQKSAKRRTWTIRANRVLRLERPNNLDQNSSYEDDSAAV